jgi:hypothetical protein
MGKGFALAIDKEYNYNKQVLYKDENFKNIFKLAMIQRFSCWASK